MKDQGRLINSRFSGSAKSLMFASLCAYSGAFSFGLVIGYTGTPALNDMRKEGLLDSVQASWFGSLMTVGAMFGCIVAGWVVENMGRKSSLLIANVPFILGWGTIFAASSVSMLYIGRILVGIASGIITVTSPLYISECATKEYRGLLGSGVQLSITVGILVVYVQGMYFHWQTMAFLSMLVPVAGFFMTLRIPETPRYHLLKNKKAEAIRALTYLRDSHVDVEEECRDIEETLDPSEKMSWSEFGKRELMQPLKVGVGLGVFQQLSGINVVMFYTVSIFENAGFKESGAAASVIIGLVQVVFTVVACFLTDKRGRRFLLLVAGIGMAVSSMALGFYFYATNGVGDVSYGWLALASLICYIVAFSLGWGPIPMVVVSEIFPVRARGRASAIATIANWICAFIVTKEFITLQEVIGMSGAFWLFGIFCMFGTVFVFRMVPETKGKSLEDIELYFMGRAMHNVQGV